jgi:hypothetical protein
MDFTTLPSFPANRSPPDSNVLEVPRPPLAATPDRTDQPKGWGVWREVPFLISTTMAAPAPLCLLVAFLDGLNDKPGGNHATIWSYAKVVLVSAVAAGVAALVRRAVGRRRTFEGEVFVPILLGGASVAAVGLTFCLWGSWVFEHGGH